MSGRRPVRWRAARTVLVAVAENVVAPLAVYGVLVLLGVPAVWALVGSAAASVVVVAVGWVRTRRVSTLGVTVGLQLLLAVAAAWVTGDVRLVLARDAATTVVVALAMAASLATRRPFLAGIHRDLTGDAAAFERRWEADPAFRGAHRPITLAWAVGLLADAAAVVAAAYLPPVGVAVVLTQVLPLPFYVGLIAWTQRRFARLDGPGTLPSSRTDQGRTPSPSGNWASSG